MGREKGAVCHSPDHLPLIYVSLRPCQIVNSTPNMWLKWMVSKILDYSSIPSNIRESEALHTGKKYIHT